MSNPKSASFDENNLNVTTTITTTTQPDVNLSAVEMSFAGATLATTATTSSNSSRINSPRSSTNDEVDASIPRNINNSSNDMDNTSVRYGKCKWFNVAKGWGFITPNDGGQEVFVHQSIIQMDGFRSLGEQEDVEFECKTTERGLEATRVSGRAGINCHGSTFHPNKKKKDGRRRRMRCYNCGEFANHIASRCELGPQPKCCHVCKQTDHLFADCPMKRTDTTSANTSANESMLSAQSVASGREGVEPTKTTNFVEATQK